MSNDAVDWSAGSSEGFGVFTPEDELFHGTGPTGDSLTETWYWGFNVPQAKINCYIYCWTHPNLKVVTAGLIIYKGIKQQSLAAELIDIPAYMSMALVGDGSDIQIPNGLRIRVIEPLRHIKITFDDQSRETALDIDMIAASIPVMRSNGKHFEQIMHTTGTLLLRGERYAVDSFTVRDRSWGEPRPETHNPIPPYNWITAVFDAGKFSFNVGSFDDPAKNPPWASHFHVPSAQVLRDGWVFRDDVTLRLTHASKSVVRNTASLRPERIEIDCIDSENNSVSAIGTVIASVPWSGWPNIVAHLALVRWECGGRIGYGESMDIQWNDFVWRYGQTS